MDILFELMLFLGPIAAAVCVVMALRGTRVKTDCPTAIKAASLNANEDRRWNLK